MRRLRVVQWATGNIGTKSLRAVIEHPNLELVGLYVHSPDKVGKDAGELCGVGSTGVIATNSITDVLALDADCVLYMQQGCDFDDVCRILESGALPRYLMQTLLEQRIDPQRRRKTKERAEYFRKLVVTLMPDDTQPHQTARRWVPRELSKAKAVLARSAIPGASSPSRASCFARGA